MCCQALGVGRPVPFAFRCVDTGSGQHDVKTKGKAADIEPFAPDHITRVGLLRDPGLGRLNDLAANVKPIARIGDDQPRDQQDGHENAPGNGTAPQVAHGGAQPVRQTQH